MKKVMIIATIIMSPLLFIGYYQTRWAEDDQIVVFIKKQPTYKIAFINVFRSDHEDNWNGYLQKNERQYAEDFCKYYVGFEKDIETMQDFRECEELYEATVKCDSPSNMEGVDQCNSSRHEWQIVQI